MRSQVLSCINAKEQIVLCKAHQSQAVEDRDREMWLFHSVWFVCYLGMLILSALQRFLKLVFQCSYFFTVI